MRLAIVGEFNAGKSTFINALIGADVAPTGVLPTTATLHHLRWAPDPFAKIVFAPGHEPRERIVPLGDLRSTLKGMRKETLNETGTVARRDAADAGAIERVELRLPLATLVRVEICSTRRASTRPTRTTRAWPARRSKRQTPRSGSSMRPRR